MDEKYVVYTEFKENGKIERWYYGCYENSNRANEVALDLCDCGRISGVCSVDLAIALRINNLPVSLLD